jgi:hypothetical protein
MAARALRAASLHHLRRLALSPIAARLLEPVRLLRQPPPAAASRRATRPLRGRLRMRNSDRVRAARGARTGSGGLEAREAALRPGCLTHSRAARRSNRRRRATPCKPLRNFHLSDTSATSSGDATRMAVPKLLVRTTTKARIGRPTPAGSGACGSSGSAPARFRLWGLLAFRSALAASVAEASPTRTAKCFGSGGSRARLDGCVLTPLLRLIPTA